VETRETPRCGSASQSAPRRGPVAAGGATHIRKNRIDAVQTSIEASRGTVRSPRHHLDRRRQARGLRAPRPWRELGHPCRAVEKTTWRPTLPVAPTTRTFLICTNIPDREVLEPIRAASRNSRPPRKMQVQMEHGLARTSSAICHRSVAVQQLKIAR